MVRLLLAVVAIKFVVEGWDIKNNFASISWRSHVRCHVIKQQDEEKCENTHIYANTRTKSLDIVICKKTIHRC